MNARSKLMTESKRWSTRELQNISLLYSLEESPFCLLAVQSSLLLRFWLCIKVRNYINTRSSLYQKVTKLKISSQLTPCFQHGISINLNPCCSVKQLWKNHTCQRWQWTRWSLPLSRIQLTSMTLSFNGRMRMETNNAKASSVVIR